jgi:hypothetical protein
LHTSKNYALTVLAHAIQFSKRDSF